MTVINAMTQLPALVCPVCRAPLFTDGGGKSLFCSGGKDAHTHCFDISAAGYVNLAGGGYRPGSGDPSDMVTARRDFLSGDWYKPLADRLAALADPSGVTADCGCGEGYYSCAAAHNSGFLCGFDLAAPAVRAAAKRARREKPGNTLFAVSSVFSLPLADGSCTTVLSVFAPCATPEFCRILKPGGRLVVAAAGKNHLLALKNALYAEARQNEPRSDLPTPGSGFTLSEQASIDFSRLLPADALRALYNMTPYSRTSTPAARDALFALPRLEVDFSFDIYVYVKD